MDIEIIDIDNPKKFPKQFPCFACNNETRALENINAKYPECKKVYRFENIYAVMVDLESNGN